MEENALQFINETGVENIHDFITSPIRANLPLLIPAPALHTVAECEFKAGHAQIDPTTLEVFRWIYVRAFVVLHQLKARGSVPRGDIPPQSDEWQKVATVSKITIQRIHCFYCA
jgi:hypothetical protein